MKIKIKTRVNGNFNKVFEAFDLPLFKVLLPPKFMARLVHFGGSRVNDKVHVQLLFPAKADWVSLITEVHESESERYFVDEGVQLPMGLSYWRHRHVVQRLSDRSSMIVDDIEFKAKNKLWELFLYPALYFSFVPRIPAYKKFFKNY